MFWLLSTTSCLFSLHQSDILEPLPSSFGNVKMPDSEKSQTRGKQANNEDTQAVPEEVTAPAHTTNTATTTSTSSHKDRQVPPDDHDLILTSAKRRGVYECDYCHSDISQMPRIRCAECLDFDLCLDCFATTDHESAIARLRAAAAAQAALEFEETQTVVTGASNHALDASTSSTTHAVTTTPPPPHPVNSHLQHDVTHGYRVCDSTRYPLFPSGRAMLDENDNASDKESALEVMLETNSAVNGQDTKQRDPENDETKGDTEMKEASEEPSKEGSVGDSKDKSCPNRFDDPKKYWTVEEDLRLLEAIKTHGLGNWNEISDSVSGNGSVGKTPKRCMERYLDDFLGRYGHILPPQLLQMETDDNLDESASSPGPTTTAADDTGAADGTPRPQKRSQTLFRSPSAVMSVPLAARKKFKTVSTASCPEFAETWPDPYIPANKNVNIGDEVGRDLSVRAEQEYVKKLSALESQEEIEKLRNEWKETRLNKFGGPTVLPPLPDEVSKMKGVEVSGFMPRRGDFDVEWENDAELAIADMEFIPGEPEQDKELKIKVLQIYYEKQSEREKRKSFILSRELFDYRKRQAEDAKLPRDERDLVHRMRLFERFHTPEEHRIFVEDLLKAKRLRKEIAKLQLYRRMGMSSFVEVEKFELDKSRRLFHQIAQTKAQEEKSKKQVQEPPVKNVDNASTSLWKQYYTDRKIRKSLSRRSSTASAVSDDSRQDPKRLTDNGEALAPPEATESTTTEPTDAMDTSSPREEGPDQTKEPMDTTDASENGTKVDESEVHPDPLAQCPGFELLSEREIGLCHKVDLKPSQYLEIKRAILHESLKAGLLDRDGLSSNKKTLVKLDVERRGDVVDFFVSAGWISNKAGSLVKDLPQQTEQC